MRQRGGRVSARSIGSLETGVVPKRGTKPPSLEPTVAALGWSSGWTDRILGGEDSDAVLNDLEYVGESALTPRQEMLSLLPSVFAFGRIAVQAGAPTPARDDFETAVQRLLDAVPADRPARGYALAAYRPHAAGEGVPADDVARIREAFEGNG